MSKHNKPMTNIEYIRSLDVKGFAPMLIEVKEIPDYDEDIDGEDFVCGYRTVFITNDNEEFCSLNDALDHEEWWLRQPYVKT